MSGVSVIRTLLATNAPVLAVIPATRIMAGDLPVGTVLPALSITQIDSLPYNLIRINDPNKMHSDRVQVSALFYGNKASTPGTGYVGVYQMMKLILAACPSQRGLVNGFAVDSIIPDIEGPDLHDEASDLYSRSRDFFVRWTA